jgi:quinol monooxygenase YgiN
LDVPLLMLETPMTVLVMLEAEVKSEKVAEMPALLAALLPSTRSFAGCGKVNAFLSQDGRKLLLVEDWATKEDYEKYGAWRVTTDHGKQLIAMMAGPPDIRYFDPLNV